MYVLLIVVSYFVLFLLANVLSVLLRYTDYDCPFDIFKVFLHLKCRYVLPTLLLLQKCSIHDRTVAGNIKNMSLVM